MRDTKISIIEQYYIKVTKLILIGCMAAVTIGFSTCTALKFYGYVGNVSISEML